jgi:hypothetical protein
MNAFPIVEEWKKVKIVDTAPHIFPGDEESLNVNNSFMDIFNFEDYTTRIDEIYENPAKMHLNLIPIPYLGNLQKAKIFILTGNPGLGPTDYEEEGNKEIRQEFINNLHQENFSEYPFFMLNPKFAWHGGYTYWVEKLGDIIEETIKIKKVRYFDALKILSNLIAVVEYNPYHSKNSPGYVDLQSSKMIKELVKEYLVNKPDTLIIVTRKVKEWGLTASDSIVLYDSGQSRGAEIGRNTSGGKAIIERLGQLIEKLFSLHCHST